MPVPLTSLQALASQFSAIREGPSQVTAGTPVHARVVSPAQNLSVTDIVPAELSLTWIAKNVRFNNHTIEPALAASPFAPAGLNGILAGGMPARAPVVGNLVGTEQLQGVPGDLGQLAGSMPLAVDVPVQVTVAWRVLDADGVTVLAEGPGTFAAPNGTGLPDATFVFAATTIEWVAGVSVPVVQRFLEASVTLTAGATVHTFTLPKLPLTIPAIPVPTVVVFFLHTNFAASNGDNDGAAFIVVPNNSPLQSVAQLQSTLNTLEQTLSTLTSIADLAAFLTGISVLSSALAAQPHIQFRVANTSNEFNNFNDVTLIQRAWYRNDTEAEDELSSLIFIGPTRRTVECFNDRNRKPGEGAFTVTIGTKLHVLVRSLHSANPATLPDAGALAVTSPHETFGDHLSSLRFP